MPVLHITQAGALAFQSAGIAGWLNPKMDLCSALPAPPDRQAVIGDFTLAAYTGYVQAACLFVGNRVEGVNGLVYMLSPLLSFPGPSSGAGVDVVGAVFQDGTAHTVWAWLAFDAPLAEQHATDLVAFTVKILEDESYNIEVVAP